MGQNEIIERMNQLYTEKMNIESQLSGGDYKVIKCVEAQAAGDQLPYDMEALHRERQQWRNRINVIETELKELEALEPEEKMPETME